MHSSPSVGSGIKPIPKKGFRSQKAGFPFPNFLLGEHEVPSICRCVFDGNNFYVLNSKDMHILNHNGSFGVSSLTHRGPSEEEPSFYLKPYFTKKAERESSSVRLIPPSSSGGGGESTKETFFTLIEASELSATSKSVHERTTTTTTTNGHHKYQMTNSNPLSSCNFKRSPITTITSDCGKGNGHLLSEDYNDDDDDAMSEIEEDEQMRKKDFLKQELEAIKSDLFLQSLRCKIEEERLILMPEEAIFLSFGVGCLTIHGPSGGSVGYRKVWKRLVESNPEFPITYAAYHYFRSKNWVPKLGDSYGASYLLYKVGPSAYHASYLVHILGFPSRTSPTWNELNAWVRLGCHVSKNVMLCEVSLPPGRFDAITSEPRSIFDMSLKETSIFRWKSSSGTSIKY